MSNELNYLLKRAARGLMSRREFVGRAGALGVSAAVASSMLATAARAEGPVKGGLLRAGMQGGESTNTLDPALAASEVPFAVNMLWGEMLVDVNAKGEIDYRIAEEISASADATEWKFKIRAGVEFHDGKTVTAEDVVATLKRHTDEKSQSGALGIVQGISEMKAEGDMVTLKLAAGNADLPFLMADYHLIIQPGGGVGAEAAGIGAGPYKVVSNEPGVRHAFEKHANYFDTTMGHADQVEIIVINDNTARTAALQAGQVHMINRVDPKIIDLLKGAPGISIEHVAGRGHYVFIMHVDKAPFDNNDLRMALKLAINRQEMVDKILGGYGSVGNDFPINGAYPLFDETIAQREYDPAAAAEYYKKSGHDGSPIVLRTAAGAFPGAVEAAELFQQSAAAAGIPLEIKREPDDGYWSDVWNVQPFCASYWGGRPVQDQMYSTAYLSTADWNDTKFKDPAFDATLIAARAELDPVKRKAMYSELANNLRDNGGLICPMFNDFVEAKREEVGGWEPDPNGELMNGRALARCWLNA
ncbi:MAG: peptide ABC transporter substrate-binding protein [Rhodobacterales bacterium RIFCSPHIGHO2_02_FULL_62_130]|jgi:peptide/nickel transport system substrate-binding protein|nr:MAG: peptide ABC transporter substrate-binding protein [Rhodobacterales bacterium RIFCSPHIGHO2_02_FULL_62_130]OHC61007.1 MAG: peptide ABC transporter substrate-binding protein [Rhodobacterales bacterium RIFCSPHIGHO2_12_FULL_62_75]HCY99149.1 peptide ABC transporter substrate-binding protein [Rhodobacter sp.]